jgi:hypothetical protein
MTLIKITPFIKARDFCCRSYDLLNDIHTKIIYSIGDVLFIMIFLWLFGPFGLALIPESVKFKLIFWYCIVCSGTMILHVYLFQDIIIKRYTVATTILWLIWIVAVCGLANFIVWEVIMDNGHFHWKYLPKLMLQTYMVASLSTTFKIVLYEKYYLKKRIRVINQVNSDLIVHQTKSIGKSEITLTSEKLSEVVTFDSDSLLYISSADNYVEINRLENGEVQRFLLRKTLTEIEKEVKSQCRHIERCHNSFIVNINQIKSISGNSAGYRINLNGNISPIPISRKYKDTFFKVFKP